MNLTPFPQGRVAQLAQRLGLDLANALVGDVELPVSSRVRMAAIRKTGRNCSLMQYAALFTGCDACRSGATRARREPEDRH